MKILIVMGGFFPGKKYGGPPVSIDNFCTLMMGKHEIFIITTNHDLFEKEPYNNISAGWNDRKSCKVKYLSDVEYCKKEFEKVIKEINPDILYLQGLFQSCVLPCLVLAKKLGVRVLLAPRGELCTGAINIKRYKKTPYITLIRILRLTSSIHWQSTSDEETEAVKKIMNVDNRHIHQLDNIPSIPKEKYPKPRKTKGEVRVVFISRIHSKKNLLYAIKLFHNSHGNVVFDIYGSIEDELYWEKCQEEIRTLPQNVTVKYKGLVEHDKIHEVFSSYDVFLFPTLSENYGHVIVEALVNNCVVILSKGTTPWDDLDNNGGFVVPLADEEQWSTIINTIIDMSETDYDLIMQSLKRYVDKKMSKSELLKQYETMLIDVTND